MHDFQCATRTRRTALTAGLALCALAAVAAPAPPKITTLALRDAPGTNGTRIAMYRAEVGAVPDLYQLDNLSVRMPVAVTLIAPTNSGLKLKLSKFGEEPLREGAVAASGVVSFTFAVQGGFYARVSGPGTPTPYELVTMVGKERTAKLYPLVVSYNAYERREAQTPTAALIQAPPPVAAPQTAPVAMPVVAIAPAPVAAAAPPRSPVLWVIAGLLGAIVVLLGAVVLKGKRS